MRPLDTLSTSFLSEETTFACQCWILRRGDGAVFGATDHDRGLSIDGVSCEPNAAIAIGPLPNTGGLAPGQAGGEGALSADFLTEEDMDNGLWNGAELHLWRVDWTDVRRRILLWSGRLGEISRSGRRFSAELLDLKTDLERPVGAVYRRRCSAELGDGKCRVVLDTPAYTGTGSVSGLLSERRFESAQLDTYADGWFDGGILIFRTGGNADGRFRVIADQRSASGRSMTINRAPARPIAIGDEFSISAGCDKSFDVCIGKFANHRNFRGFPHLLGNDALLAGPLGSGRDDGGQR